MDWWVWAIVAVVVLALLIGAALAVQVRRRSGGVIARRGGRSGEGGKGGWT